MVAYTKRMVILTIFPILLSSSLCFLWMNHMNRQDRFDSLFQYVCESYTFDWKLIKAMAIVESTLNPMAVSRVGAKGLMQLMDGTAADMRVIQVFDPEQNVKGGAAYFDWLLLKFYTTNGDKVKFALASYNGGFGYILEAQHLAIKEGKDSWKWDEVKGMLWKCVVNGKRPDAKQIIEHVEKVMTQYQKLKGGESE